MQPDLSLSHLPIERMKYSIFRTAKLTITTTDRAICPGSKGLFVPVLEPGQGRRDKSAGGFCPGW